MPSKEVHAHRFSIWSCPAREVVVSHYFFSAGLEEGHVILKGGTPFILSGYVGEVADVAIKVSVNNEPLTSSLSCQSEDSKVLSKGNKDHIE